MERAAVQWAVIGKSEVSTRSANYEALSRASANENLVKARPWYFVVFTSYFLLFQDWVVAVADELGAGAFGFFDVTKGTDLHVKECVGGGIHSSEGGILLLL